MHACVFSPSGKSTITRNVFRSGVLILTNYFCKLQHWHTFSGRFGCTFVSPSKLFGNRYKRKHTEAPDVTAVFERGLINERALAKVMTLGQPSA